jgi:hypothetical protein
MEDIDYSGEVTQTLGRSDKPDDAASGERTRPEEQSDGKWPGSFRAEQDSDSDGPTQPLPEQNDKPDSDDAAETTQKLGRNDKATAAPDDESTAKFDAQSGKALHAAADDPTQPTLPRAETNADSGGPTEPMPNQALESDIDGPLKESVAKDIDSALTERASLARDHGYTATDGTMISRLPTEPLDGSDPGPEGSDPEDPGPEDPGPHNRGPQGPPDGPEPLTPTRPGDPIPPEILEADRRGPKTEPDPLGPWRG